MFTETNMRKIQNFSAIDPVVSLYLNTEPSRGNAETHRLRLRSMLKELPLNKDVDRIEQFFGHQYDWSGRAVAVFSCAPANFFEFIPLALPVRDFIKVGKKAETEPLEDLLQDFNNLGVVLVDQQGARLFHFNLGELVEQRGMLGDLVKHVKSGSASSEHGLRGGAPDNSRNLNETIHRNSREIAEFAEKFFITNKIKRIMIGGTDDNVAQFRGYLSKSMQSLVVGTFAMGMTANHTEILNKIGMLAKLPEEK
jgi:peptide chain release factor subunit 1